MNPTIVVTLDQSEQSKSALPLAQALANRRKLPLTLFSVVEVPPEFVNWVETAAENLEGEEETWTAERRAYLEEVAAGLSGLDVRQEIRIGIPSQEIARYVAELDNPVLVMASHGGGGIEQIVLGSVTFQTLHHIHCPVFVTRMPAKGEAARPPMFDKVLVPLDGSAFSERALDAALAILGTPRPAIHLLRIIKEPGWTAEADESRLITRYLTQEHERANQHLQEIAERLAGDGYRATWEVRQGNVSREIRAVADEIGASEIAMSTHGRGGLGRLFLGSVAQSVLNHSPIPLLLIRPDGDESTSGSE